MWSLALKTLVADRGKTLTALVGVVFSIVLVNIQGGLFLGLIGKASLLVDHARADIWVGHKSMHNVDFPADIPRRWADRIRTIPGVRRAEPYLLGFSDMTLPSGAYEGVVVVGVDPKELLGGAWNIVQGEAESIVRTDGILIDRCEDAKLEFPRLGDLREIGGHRARVVAFSHGITGFLVNPYVFTTLDRAAEFLHKGSDVSSYFLVQLVPGADRHDVCRAIRRRVPELDALASEDYGRLSVNYWMTRTGMGISFGAATLLGVLVGLVMVAQTLYAMVLDRLGEFGALKAIGATETQIFSVLIAQAVAMALVGSAIGLTLSGALQRMYDSPRAPIVIPCWLSWGSCILVLAICTVSALLPYHRVRKVDPLMVLQS